MQPKFIAGLVGFLIAPVAIPLFLMTLCFGSGLVIGYLIGV